MITGGCLCGAVRYQASGEPLLTRVCWCRLCQKIGAGSGTVNVGFNSAELRVEGALTAYESTADSGTVLRRGFCPVCGTPGDKPGGNAQAPDFCARRHPGRSGDCAPGGDDLGFGGAELGVHCRGFAAGGGAAATSRLIGPRHSTTFRRFEQSRSSCRCAARPWPCCRILRRGLHSPRIAAHRRARCLPVGIPIPKRESIHHRCTAEFLVTVHMLPDWQYTVKSLCAGRLIRRITWLRAWKRPPPSFPLPPWGTTRAGIFMEPGCSAGHEAGLCRAAQR